MTTDPVRQAYAGAAPGWAEDASLVYEPLARHLLARSPVSVAGLLLLDVGSGTGVGGSVLRQSGARVVESDFETTMLAHGRATRSPAVAADVAALPFAPAVFDGVFAAFLLNHVGDPAAGLAELARVTRSRGIILASTFASERAPAKQAFDSAARRHGWRAPPWYDVMSGRAEAFGTAESMLAAARLAGLDAITITETPVQIDLGGPEMIVRYRLGMPQYASWLEALDAPARRRMVAEAVVEIDSPSGVFRPTVLELVAHAN